MTAYRLIPLVTICALSLTTRSAYATDQAMNATAQQLYEEGQQAYLAGNWQACHAKSLAAWRVVEHAQIAGLLGDCELKLGEHRNAAEHLLYFVVNAPMSTPERRMKHAEDRLKEARRHVAEIHILIDPPDAKVTLAGAVLKRASLDATFVTPGQYTLAAERDGYRPASRNITATAGASQTITFTLNALDGTRSTGLTVGGIISLGVGIVGVGAGIGLLAAGGSKTADADARLEALQTQHGQIPCPNQAGCTDLRDDRQSSDTLRGAGLGAVIGGGVLSAVGLSLLLGIFDGSSDDASDAASVAENASHANRRGALKGLHPWISPQRVGASWRLRF